MVQIFAASSRESGAEALSGEPHVIKQRGTLTDVVLVLNAS